MATNRFKKLICIKLNRKVGEAVQEERGADDVLVKNLYGGINEAAIIIRAVIYFNDGKTPFDISLK